MIASGALPLGGWVGAEPLAWPLAFAAGAVLASLADSLMPEALEGAKENPWIHPLHSASCSPFSFSST